MRVCLVHNEYGSRSGEEVVVEGTLSALEGAGHGVRAFRRSSAAIRKAPLGRVRAFLSGTYNFSSRDAMRRLLEEQSVDLVHVHNLFPLISASVLGQCREAGVPVVMTVHNYRLVCPSGLHMTDGRVCEKCCGGREYWCVLRNCEKSFFKSLGYALRTYAARRWRLFLDNVTMYAALTEFQRQRLIREGFGPDRIAVVPNMAETNHEPAVWTPGEYVAYAGRISPEKGIPVLLAAARRTPWIRFKAAGSYERWPEVTLARPRNVEFLGHCQAMGEFYRNARIVVLPTLWFEGFPGVIAEAMVAGKPVLCSRIGGLPEIVDDGLTGLLVAPGSAAELAEKIRYLWDRPELCRKMGLAGRAKALREYSPQRYYERLMGVYERAIALGPGGPGRRRKASRGGSASP